MRTARHELDRRVRCVLARHRERLPREERVVGAEQDERRGAQDAPSVPAPDDLRERGQDETAVKLRRRAGPRRIPERLDVGLVARVGARSPEEAARALMAAGEGIVLHRVTVDPEAEIRPVIDRAVRASLD
ncbi:hypothetical protein [Microbacterium immunditiarum]